MNIVDKINIIRRNKTLSNVEKNALESAAITEHNRLYRGAIESGVFKLKSMKDVTGKLSSSVINGD